MKTVPEYYICTKCGRGGLHHFLEHSPEGDPKGLCDGKVVQVEPVGVLGGVLDTAKLLAKASTKVRNLTKQLDQERAIQDGLLHDLKVALELSTPHTV